MKSAVFLGKAALSVLKEFGLFIILCIFFIGSYIFVEKFQTYEIVPAAADTAKLSEPSHGSSESEAPYITDIRIIKEHDGKIGVYDCFDNLVGSFDINVGMFPSGDREELREGIVFPSEDELRDFLASLDS